VCFIIGSYSKSRARPARRGWGRLGLENRAIAAQTGWLPVTCANDYRSLAVLGRGLVARIRLGANWSIFPRVARSPVRWGIRRSTPYLYMIPWLPWLPWWPTQSCLVNRSPWY